MCGILCVCVQIYLYVYVSIYIYGWKNGRTSYQSLNKQKHSIFYLCFISSQVSCGLFSFLECYKELCTVFGMLCNCQAFILSDFSFGSDANVAVSHLKYHICQCSLYSVGHCALLQVFQCFFGIGRRQSEMSIRYIDWSDS